MLQGRVVGWSYTYNILVIQPLQHCSLRSNVLPQLKSTLGNSELR